VLPIKFFRPLVGDVGLYPRYRSDGALAEHIVKWAQNIKLANSTFNLDIRPDLIYQITSNKELNAQFFMASVDSIEMVDDILRHVHETLDSQHLKCKFPKKSVGGILYLQRFIQRRPRKRLKTVGRL
jgi:hypothetical protein